MLSWQIFRSGVQHVEISCGGLSGPLMFRFAACYDPQIFLWQIVIPVKSDVNKGSCLGVLHAWKRQTWWLLCARVKGLFLGIWDMKNRFYQQESCDNITTVLIFICWADFLICTWLPSSPLEQLAVGFKLQSYFKPRSPCALQRRAGMRKSILLPPLAAKRDT